MRLLLINANTAQAITNPSTDLLSDRQKSGSTLLVDYRASRAASAQEAAYLFVFKYQKVRLG
jgi:hypothetical protein